ncbi:MAG: cytochrome c [Halieaceae bacterium]|jgi:mono/diheme cytochrome c family protein|nr:cytochrome c [Halieaceae bacterium]
MKLQGITSCIVSLLLLFPIFVAAQDHQTATAPAEFLEMENPVDPDDVDDAFLKSAGKLYKRKCKKCHGTKGDGQGSAAEDIEIKPTDFTVAGYMEGKEDGQLFWIIRDGSEGTEMEAFGPGTDVNISEENIWNLVSFMRAKFTN